MTAIRSRLWSILLLALVPAGAVAQSSPAPQSTAIVVSATNDPLRVTGSDGLDHLEYDLIVTNGFLAPVTLTAIGVLTPGGDTLLTLDGDALAMATQPILLMGPTAEIPASGTVAVVMDVAVPSDATLERLTHRIAYDIAPDAPVRSVIGSFTVDGPELAVDPREAIVIAPPLRGDGWLVGQGCCASESLHRSWRIPVDGTHIAKPETFALDWVQLQNGRLFEGDGSRPEQWFGYGAEVLAVADGTVVYVSDDLPNETPGQPAEHVKAPGDYGGNQVAIEIGPGVFAFYGHLQPGSITVAEGDTVTTGQPIARLGNSGNSTAPHLHFGLIDGPDAITGNSLPLVFDRYTVAGTIDLETFLTAEGDATLPFDGTPRSRPPRSRCS